MARMKRRQADVVSGRSASETEPADIADVRNEIKSVLKALQETYIQTDIANEVGLHQPQISQLSKGKDVFSNEARYIAVLQSLQLLQKKTQVVEEDAKKQIKILNKEFQEPSYTTWLLEQLAALDIDEMRLYLESGIALPVIDRILTGVTSNPQSATRKKIKDALTAIAKQKGMKLASDQTYTDPVRDSLFVGLPFTHEYIKEVPETAGVYVIHDRRGFPLYIGSSKRLRGRLVDHSEHRDFVGRKNAAKFSYYVIPNRTPAGKARNNDEALALARAMEVVFIKFAANAVSHNDQHRVNLAD